MEKRLKLIAIFLLSTALIAYELFIMRVFSVGSWTNFGSLIISTALLGFGISGTLLTFILSKIRKRIEMWMTISSLLFFPTMAGAYIVSQMIPFNPVFIGSDPNQLLYIGLYYVVFGVPFFFGATYIGLAFIALEKRIHYVYFWNMLGSGIGGLILLALMDFVPTDSLIMPIILLAFFGHLFTSMRPNKMSQRLEIETATLVASALLLVISLGSLFMWGEIRVSEYKAISYVRKYPDVTEIYRDHTPAGEFHVYGSSYFHFAPGLSDNAVLELENMPDQPFWGLYIDGNGPIGIMGEIADEEAAEYMDFLPMAAPYAVMSNPNVLLVNLGGGISAQIATYQGAEKVTVYEENPEIYHLMADTPSVRAFTGDLLREPEINGRIGDARSHLTEKSGAFDLVEIGLIDSIGLSDSGGYAIDENYTYTSEAIAEYMKSLSPDGMLSITVWNRLSPPRNVLKLMSTVVHSLRAQGVENPEDRIFVFDLFLSTATIIVKNDDLTAGEIYDLRKFCERRSFSVAYYPGMEKRDLELDTILATYRNHFELNQAIEQNVEFSPNDFYHLALYELLEGNPRKLYRDYVFDVTPMRDSRPYYTGFLKLGEISMYLDQVQDVSEDWGYLLRLGILLQSIILGALVITMPVVGRWRELFKKQRGTIGVILYFACLGLGFMLVEIFLIQKLVFILTNPIYSVSIVITSMLIISALGNLTSSFISKSRTVIVRVACIGILASMAFYIFGLNPVLNAFRDQSMFIRILISIAVIAPSAFFLGMPFPNGLDGLTENRPRLLPWAWGMNGGLSVTGSALAWIFSVAYGFNVVLVSVIVLYAIVGIIFPVNEIKTETG